MDASSGHTTGEPCPACDGRVFRLRYESLVDYEYRVPITPDLVECRSCGLLRQHPLPTNSDLPAFYPDDYMVYSASFRQAGSLYSKIKNRVYAGQAKKVVKAIGSRGRVLDVGCANGAFLESLDGLGVFELHGLDIKNTGIDFASRGIKFQEGTLEDASYPDDHFDAVMMDNLIEHVPDLKAFIQKAWRILKPGGHLFGLTPNHGSLDRRVFGRYWGGFHMPRHIWLFNSRNLPLFLEKSGFTDIRLPATANSGDWAVSVQNFMRRNRDERGRYKRAPYFPFVGILFAPVSLVTSLLNMNGVMAFRCRK